MKLLHFFVVSLNATHGKQVLFDNISLLFFCLKYQFKRFNKEAEMLVLYPCVFYHSKYKKIKKILNKWDRSVRSCFNTHKLFCP